MRCRKGIGGSGRRPGADSPFTGPAVESEDRCLPAATDSGRRAAARWQPVGALPPSLPVAAALPSRATVGGDSFRPTASRTCRPNQKKNQIRPPSHSPLEEDTSTWQKSGHSYFALTRTLKQV